MSRTTAEAWLSTGRFDRYLTHARGDVSSALRLYDWNAELSSACLKDLGHLEVAIRNAYDRVLTQRYANWSMVRPGIQSPGQLFGSVPVVRSKAAYAARLNGEAIKLLVKAQRDAGRDGSVLHGRVLANLSFGFWAFLTEPLRANHLWNGMLSRAFPAGVERSWVHPRMEHLNLFRNRLAHLEPTFAKTSALTRNLRELGELLSAVSPEVADWTKRHSRVYDLVAEGRAYGVIRARPNDTYFGENL